MQLQRSAGLQRFACQLGVITNRAARHPWFALCCCETGCIEIVYERSVSTCCCSLASLQWQVAAMASHAYALAAYKHLLCSPSDNLLPEAGLCNALRGAEAAT